MQLRALPAFADNYIWLLVDDSGGAIVVDPGDAGPVIAAASQGLRPHTVLLTHHHPDHAGGMAQLQERYGVHCIGPADDRIRGLDRHVGEGDHVQLHGLENPLRVMFVPGHTRTHIAFQGNGLLFCGDTLFSLGCGRLFEGTPAQMLDSLERLAALPDATLVCCGHEYTQANGRFASTVDPDNPALRTYLERVAALRSSGAPSLPGRMGVERELNPFLRVDEPAMRGAVAARETVDPGDRVAVFAALRRWKDVFSA
ncbi:MAG TPA: hydroxyacylglutathione hydrolase [Xanthomonadaceae bacterium]|nr:hydroxyacylglutathione hydrolase [Xanthomonadaceae bacterium]